MKTDSPNRCRAACITLVSVLALYLPVFFAHDATRLDSFCLVLVPDLFVSSWFGHNIENFGCFDRLPVLFVVGVILLAALAVGRWSLDAARAVDGLTRLEKALFSLAVGLGVWSSLTLLLGLLGWLHHRWLFCGLLMLAVGWGAYRWRGHFRSVLPHREGWFSKRSESRDGNMEPADGPNWLPSWFALLGIPFLLVIVLGGILPPWEFDVREYHLQVPKEWFQAGRISFLEHNVYGNMPLGAEMHALLGMTVMRGERAWWWGALVGKTIIALFAVLTALTLFSAGRRFAGRTAGLVAALVYISIPWVVHVSVTGLIEGVLGFYTLTAVYAILLWRSPDGVADDSAEPECVRGKLLLGGYLAGCAAACKYPALLFVMAPLFVYVLLGMRRPSARNGVLFLAAVCCGCGLWYGKNAWQTGNPVYPLVFGGETRTVERMEQWTRAHQVPRDEHGRRYSAPQAIASVADFGWKGLFQSPLLLPLALMAVWTIRRRRTTAWLAAYVAITLLAWWLFTHRLDRFWVPMLPILCLLAGIGVASCEMRLWRWVCAGFLVFGMAYCLLLTLTAPNQDHRYLATLDYLRIDRPTTADYSSRVHPVHRLLNENASRIHRVLLVGDAQPFDLEVPVLYNTCFDENLFERMMKDRSRDERLNELFAQQISHIFFDWEEIDRYRQEGNYGFTDYVTREFVRDELAGQQHLIRRIPLGMPPETGELYEVLAE